MPKVNAEHRQARRDQIVEAAMVCFATHGVQPTTMQDICKQAKLSAGAVYLYFKSKDALIAAVAQKGQEMIQTTLTDLRQRARPGQALEELVRVFSGLFTGEHPFYRDFGGKLSAQTMRRMDVMLRAEALCNPKVMAILAKNYGRLQAEVTELAKEAQVAGTARQDIPAQTIAQTLNSLFIGLETQLAYDPTLDIAAYVKAARNLIAAP